MGQKVRLPSWAFGHEVKYYTRRIFVTTAGPQAPLIPRPESRPGSRRGFPDFERCVVTQYSVIYFNLLGALFQIRPLTRSQRCQQLVVIKILWIVGDFVKFSRNESVL